MPPKFDLSEASEEMASFEIPGKARVEIGWIGEGNSGDYDEDDPKDTPLLRFDALDLAAHKTPQECEGGEACYERDPRCRSAQDASYCTQLPATLPKDVLTSVCRAIAQDIADKPHWKRLLEEWSWVNEARARGIHKALAEAQR